MSVDWNKVLEDQASDPMSHPVPEGAYDTRIVKAEYSKASTGSDMIKLTVEIESGPYAGRWVWTNMVFKFDSTAAARMLLRRLAAFGITGEYLAAQNPSVTQIATALIGRSAVADVNQREFQGDVRNDVNMFRAKPDGATPAPPTVAAAADHPSTPATPVSGMAPTVDQTATPLAPQSQQVSGPSAEEPTAPAQPGRPF